MLRPEAQQLDHVSGEVERVGDHAALLERHRGSQLLADVGEQGVTSRHLLVVQLGKSHQVHLVDRVDGMPDGDGAFAHSPPPMRNRLSHVSGTLAPANADSKLRVTTGTHKQCCYRTS